MKNTLKTISPILISLVLAAIMLAAFVIVPAAKVSAAVTYNNTLSASAITTVSAGGQLQTKLKVNGYNGVTTRIETELYVEKRILGIFWKRVNIGTPNNVWTDYVNSYQYSNTFTTQLSSTGTYRVTVQFTVSGSGGSPDVIPKVNTVTY